VHPFTIDRTDLEHFQWYFNEASELTEKRWSPPPGAHASPNDWRIGKTTSTIEFIGGLQQQLEALPSDDEMAVWLKQELEATLAEQRNVYLFNLPTYLDLVQWWATRKSDSATLTDFCSQFEKRN